MQVLDLITCSGTGGGGAATAVPPIAGDSLSVRQFSPAYKCRLLAVHVLSLFSDNVRLVSARLHDDIKGIQFHASPLTGGYSLLPEHPKQYLVSGDQLRVDVLASANPVVVLLSPYYTGLEAATKYITADELERRAVQMRSVFYSTAGIVSTAYSNQVSLSDGLFKSDKEYAVLGFHGEGTEAFLRIKGEETGKFSIGFPSFSFIGESVNYFAALSRKFSLATVPVMSGINISTAVLESIGFTEISGHIFFAELS